VLAAVRPLPAEEVALDDVLGRVLAESVVADVDLPPFVSSAMDGYAVAAGAEGELEVIGEARAGHPTDVAVRPGTAVRISTGAVVPEGTGAVVPVERTEPAGDGRVRVERLPDGANIRGAGEDVRAGEAVLHPGTEVGAAEAGVLAAVGRGSVRCARRPRVAVLATGDELRAPGEALGPGQIRDSNAVALAAQAALAGGHVVSNEVVGDTFDSTADALRTALDRADLVTVSGGVSVGPHDHVKPALAELGVEEIFWGVSLKPGKPTWFGRLGHRLVFGLPGNPVSAMVTFQLFARPALRALMGADPAARRATAALGEPVRLSARAQAIRCRLSAGDDGWRVAPTKAQGSHVLTSMLGAGALAFLPEGSGELAAGSRVDIELL